MQIVSQQFCHKQMFEMCLADVHAQPSKDARGKDGTGHVALGCGSHAGRTRESAYLLVGRFGFGPSYTLNTNNRLFFTFYGQRVARR